MNRNTKPQPQKTPGPGSFRSASRWVLISVGSLLALLIAAVVVVVLLGVHIELDWLKQKIETTATEALGRSVAIDGPLTLVPSVPPAAQIEGVTIGNPEGWPEADLARLNLARVALRVWPLLRGELVIEEIHVDGLQLHLETDSDGQPNWLVAESDQASSSPEPATAESTSETEPAVLRFIELAALSLRNVVLSHHDAKTGKDFTVTFAEITGSALDQEPMDLLIQGTVQELPYRVVVGAGSLAALVAGNAPWPLDVEAEAAGTRLSLAGEIAEPLRGRGLDLEMSLAGPNMEELGDLLGADLPSLESFALTGRIQEADGRYSVIDLEGEIAATGVTGSFEVDLSGDRPRLLGNVLVRSLDVGPVLEAMDAQGTNGNRAEPAAARSTTPERSDSSGEEVDLDEPVLILDAMQTLDAQLGLTIDEVVNGPTSIREISLAMNIEDGTLSAPMGVTLAEVPFRGDLVLGPVDGRPKLSVSLSGEQSDIGELASLLTNAEGIQGRFGSAELGLSASGESIRSLVDTAELRFSLEDARLSYGHGADGRPVEFALDDANLLFPATGESQITARGALLGEPFSLQLNGGTFIENFLEESWPIELKAFGGGADITLLGTIRRAQGDTGSEMEFAVSGDQIGALSAWLGINPEATQSYALEGKVTHDQSAIRIQVDDARIGESSFSGAAGIKYDNQSPVTFARLDFELLQFTGLQSLAAEQPPIEPGSELIRTGSEALTIEVPILPHGIEIFDSDIEIAVARIKLDPADVTEVSIKWQIRDGYVDQAPITAVIGGASFQGHFGIDLRGEIPKIQLEIGSSNVDVGTLLAQLGVIEDLDMQADSFALALGLEGATASQMLQRSTLSVGIAKGDWVLSAPGAEQALDIRLAEVEVSAEPGKQITLAIDGRIDKTPVLIKITTDSLGTFAGPKKELQMGVGIDVANAQLSLSGAAPLPVRADDLHFAMELTGERFSDFDELLDVSLPPFGPYRLSGNFGSRESGYYVEALQVGIGESTLTGALDLETARQPPRLLIDLLAERIQLDDFAVGEWSATGATDTATDDAKAVAEAQAETEAGPEPRILLSPEVMRSLDARATVAVQEVVSGQDRLGRGTLTATLKDGRLQVEPLTVELPGGAVDVRFAIEPGHEEVTLEAGARIEQLEYGILARRIDPESKTGGVISVDLDLVARAPDLEHIMAGANGHIDVGLWPHDLNAEVFELWAVNVITAVMSEMDRDESSRVNCVVLSFQVEDGQMRERVLFADTSRMRVEGAAEIDFNQRTLDVRARPSAKRPQFFSLAVPVGLRGRFEDFGININPVLLTGQAVSFVTSPVHVPLRRLFSKTAPADGAEACATAWNMRNAGDAETAAPQ